MKSDSLNIVVALLRQAQASTDGQARARFEAAAARLAADESAPKDPETARNGLSHRTPLRRSPLRRSART